MSNADDGGDVAFNFQSKALSITAPAVWNSLSPTTKKFRTITTFKAQLQIHTYMK